MGTGQARKSGLSQSTLYSIIEAGTEARDYPVSEGGGLARVYAQSIEVEVTRRA